MITDEVWMRRSSVHGSLASALPVWGEIAGMRAALLFAEPAAETQRSKDLALCDLTSLPKITLRGESAILRLEKEVPEVPWSIYDFKIVDTYRLIMRIDRHEMFLEGGPGDALFSTIRRWRAEGDSDLSITDSQLASFLVCGNRANLVMLETCGYDFSQESKSLVMTRVAGVSCAVLALAWGEVPCFRIWVEYSYGSYLWESLFRIIEEKGGGMIGLRTVFPCSFH